MIANTVNTAASTELRLLAAEQQADAREGVSRRRARRPITRAARAAAWWRDAGETARANTCGANEE